MAAALDHADVPAAATKRVTDLATGTHLARRIEAGPQHIAVAITMDGGAGRCASGDTSNTDGSLLDSDYIPIASGGTYTLTLTADDLARQGLPFFVSGETAAAIPCLQYLGL